MINVKQLLENININTSSRSAAVAGVREYIELADEANRLEAAIMFFYDVFGMRPSVTDATTARIAAQYAVDEISQTNYEFGNAPKLIEDAVAKAAWYKMSPKNAWQFATSSSESSFKVDSDVPKAPKKNKNSVATALYLTHIKNAATPMTNGEFVDLLVKELDTTKSGARTFAYNAKKAVEEAK